MFILKREIIKNSRSTMIWTLSLLFYNVCMLLLYPYMMDSMKDKMNVMLAAFPKEMLLAFGLDKVSMTEILGFYNTYCYLMVTILGGIFAILQGISILSKEEEEKTVEFLMSKPVTRNRIITEKLFALLTNIIILNAVVSIFSYVIIELITDEKYSMKAMLLLFFAPIFMQITFAAIGLLISVFLIKARKTFPTGVGLVLGLYFMSIIATISDKVEFLKYLTPFKYIDGAALITKQSIETVYLVIMVIVTLACTFATYLVYNRKDIVA